MRQMVLMAVLAAAPIAAVAVIGMIALGLHEGDGLAATISGNLMTIALTIVVAISGVVQHFLGATAASGTAASAPATAPADSSSSSSPTTAGGA